jgi:addiction module RelE/StbE family toxin
VKLEWSLQAREEIFDYIAAENPSAAIRIDELISQRVQVLMQYPESGRTGRVAGTRELVITGTPYIAAYRIAADANPAYAARLTHMAESAGWMNVPRP